VDSDRSSAMMLYSVSVIVLEQLSLLMFCSISMHVMVCAGGR
jgi:hypothetical protein